MTWGIAIFLSIVVFVVALIIYAALRAPEDPHDAEECAEDCDRLVGELAEWRRKYGELLQNHESLAKRLNDFFTEEAIEAPGWTAEDAAAFKKFLETEYGKKFLQYLQALEQARNRYVIQHFPHEPAMVGAAKGYGQCLARVVSLSAAVQPESDENNDAPRMQGADELREKLTP